MDPYDQGHLLRLFGGIEVKGLAGAAVRHVGKVPSLHNAAREFSGHRCCGFGNRYRRLSEPTLIADRLTSNWGWRQLIFFPHADHSGQQDLRGLVREIAGRLTAEGQMLTDRQFRDPVHQ
jgi:hypothetical protein